MAASPGSMAARTNGNDDYSQQQALAAPQTTTMGLIVIENHPSINSSSSADERQGRSPARRVMKEASANPSQIFDHLAMAERQKQVLGGLIGAGLPA